MQEREQRRHDPQAHIELSEQETARLKHRIEQDYSVAIIGHQARIKRFTYYYRLWRSRVASGGGILGESNFKVPVIEIFIMAKLAQMVDALLGDDAEVIAQPIGPEDQEAAPRVGLYMSWLVFVSMSIVNPLITALFRMLMFGRSIVYIPYVIDEYETLDGDKEIEFEGPKFIPILPDDFIVPPEDVETLHDFSFVIRRYRETPNQLLDGEAAGRYFGISKDPEKWANIVRASMQAAPYNRADEPIKDQRDRIEGVTMESAAVGGALEIHEWYGRYRFLKPNQDGEIDNLEVREMRETDVVVHYMPDTKEIIGIKRLDVLYDKMGRDKRPFDEFALQATGEYWCKGYCEILAPIEEEVTVNSNLATEAIELAIGPPIFVKPAAGTKLRKAKYGPRQLIEVENPREDAQQMNVTARPDLSAFQEQKLMSYAERSTGISDQTLGRAIDRPNAPRTARGQLALIDQGNIRQSLDNTISREHWRRILRRIWRLDSMYAPAEKFFRVTEEKAQGLFDGLKNGFGKMTSQERGGRYDFDIKFATSIHGREAKKQNALALTQLTLSTPLVSMDPQATWRALNDLYKAFGNDSFKSIAPQPPELDVPREAKEEHTRALQGLEIRVHHLDRDDEHMEQHKQHISETSDPDAKAILIAHNLEHEAQKQKKLAMAAQIGAQMELAEAAGIQPEMMMDGLQAGEQPPPPEAGPPAM